MPTYIDLDPLIEADNPYEDPNGDHHGDSDPDTGPTDGESGIDGSSLDGNTDYSDTARTLIIR